MNTDLITRERVDELLAFLPFLSDPDARLEPEWKIDREMPDGSRELIWPHPIYPPVVDAFFDAAARPCWCDCDYLQKNPGTMLRNDEIIACASLAEIKTMLTFCVRGERFFDGHWETMVSGGRITAILHRLEQLREAMA